MARRSTDKIYKMFLEYKAKGDFAVMDTARKFLQMGYTRSRRYANHKSGRKYESGVTHWPFETFEFEPRYLPLSVELQSYHSYLDICLILRRVVP